MENRENDLATTIQLTEEICSREPIHAPAAIQPHGALLAFSLPNLQLLTNSANLSRVCPSFTEAAGATWLPSGVVDAVKVLAAPKGPPEVTIMAAIPDLGWRAVHCFRSDDAAFVEFDVEASDPGPADALVLTLSEVLRRFQAARDLDTLGADLVAIIRNLTGFERVLLYRFDEKGDGDVIGESLVEDWPQSLMGLHFPASDIPAQARELYRRVVARWIPVRDYNPVDLLPPYHPGTRAAFDIGFSQYRSVSPVHILYQRNLGVDGAMSVSILLNGALWGLVVGHHRQPHHVPFAIRQHVAGVVNSFALGLAALTISGETAAVIEHTDRRAKFLSKLAGTDDFGEAMTVPPLVVTEMFADCSGVAVIYRDERRQPVTRLIGCTPPSGDVLRLMEWLRAYDPTNAIATDCISSIFPAFAVHAKDASGVLAVFFGDGRDHALLWFRPEVIREVNWGGRPEKKLDATGTTYLPRRSFERWIEKKRGHSQRWLPWEIDIAEPLSTTLTDVILRQNRRIKELNGEVERFLWVTSHHLREAPRRLLICCQQLRQHLGEQLDPVAGDILDEMSEKTQIMDLRLRGLAAYSEFGQEGNAEPKPLWLSDVVKAVCAKMDHAIRASGGAVRVQDNLPEVLGDRRGLMLVFQSLIGNALEFSSPDRAPEINLWAQRHENIWTIGVGDNGVGIAPELHERAFNLFETLHSASESKGIGLGLTLCRRIIEWLGGRIWLNSVPDRGTTVHFTLPAVPTSDEASAQEQRGAGVDTLNLLRGATRSLHEQTEQLPVMIPLSEGRVSPAQYRDALAAVYGFYRPAEERLFGQFPNLSETMEIRPKLPALIHDLVALGMTEMEVADLPVCDAVPAPDKWEQGLGMAYVLEGATLGGQVILKRVGHCLGGVASQATSFHNFHGDQTGPHWRCFQNRLGAQLDNSALAQQNAVESAVATFNALNTWLSKASPSRPA